MATPVEIVFVGLCTFMNVENTHTTSDLPPPSAIVHTMQFHESFIAFDESQVTVTPANIPSKPLDDPRYRAIAFRGGGEELQLAGDPETVPDTDESSFEDLAKFPEYSRIADLEWDENYVPNRKDRPTRDRVAAYVPFGGGKLRATRPTRVKYVFLRPDEPLTTTGAKAYMRDVVYTFTSRSDNFQIVAKSLRGEADRTITFTPKTAGGLVKLWIGTSTDPLGEIEQVEPHIYGAGPHFTEYYKTEIKTDIADITAIPVPIHEYLDGRVAPRQIIDQSRRALHAHSSSTTRAFFFHAGHLHRRADPELGYCGGSQSGCDPCP